MASPNDKWLKLFGLTLKCIKEGIPAASVKLDESILVNGCLPRIQGKLSPADMKVMEKAIDEYNEGLEPAEAGKELIDDGKIEAPK